MVIKLFVISSLKSFNKEEIYHQLGNTPHTQQGG